MPAENTPCWQPVKVVPACGTCGWSGPSYQGVVAVVADPVGRGRPRLRCGPLGWNRSSGVFTAGLAEISFLVQCRGGGLSPAAWVFFLNVSPLFLWQTLLSCRCLFLLLLRTYTSSFLIVYLMCKVFHLVSSLDLTGVLGSCSVTAFHIPLLPFGALIFVLATDYVCRDWYQWYYLK